MRQDHPMTPGVLDARQQHEPNHPGRRAEDGGYESADMADQGAKQFRAGQAGMYTAEDMCSQASQGYRDGYAAAKGEACPEVYVMVPVEPTQGMLAAGKYALEAGCYSSGIYADMIAAAPAVQGEPVEAVNLAYELGDLEGDELGPVSDEQEPFNREDRYIVLNSSRLSVEQVASITHTYTDALVAGVFVDIRWPEFEPVWSMISKQRPAPDITHLVEALEQGFPLLSDDGLDEVEHHCEWVIQQERKRLHTILAAYRKGDQP